MPVQTAAGKQLLSPDHAQAVANAPAQLDALETITQGIVQVKPVHTAKLAYKGSHCSFHAQYYVESADTFASFTVQAPCQRLSEHAL